MQTETEFWGKVRRGFDCWEWQGGINGRNHHQAKGGYGYVHWEERQQRAHRVAWQLTNGPIPDGMQVLHRCDNRTCVRPDHLFLGTLRDNTRDMMAKGRQRFGGPRYGTANGSARLTEDEVRFIRNQPASLSSAALARELGVASSTICAVRRGVTWTWVRQ